ncbi:uncharacterized protein LOC130707373 isoform X3 [Balaenoptera acutorostrata]|uniref:Uncharacterized protein LOC130707373 isoform X3 n=1 Tax=Balaenoptera acutorostrata TaxID=9767 RepID=A0ABM3T668_BALAC|nr:uncharacterized protein LOC130707373 isoform X3 [Balaenoptera acutorostrata]
MGRGGAEPRRARPSEGAGQSSHWARSGWPLGAWGERGPRRGGAILFPALLPAPGEGTVWRRRRRRRGQRGRRRRLCPGMVVWGNAEGGGVTDGHGEGKTRAGVHEGDAVLHSAVTGREGNSFDQPSGREKKTLRGSSGDEASCSFLEIVCCEGCRYLLCRIQLLLFLLCDFEKFWFPSLQNKYVSFLSPLVLSPSLQSPPLCNCPALILLKPSLCWDPSVTFITSAVTCVLVVVSSDSEEILSLLHQARFLFLSQI